MEASKIVIFDQKAACLEIDTKGISSPVPANDEDVLHSPAARNLRLGGEFLVGPCELFDTIHSFGPNHSAPTLLKKPAEYGRNLSKPRLECCKAGLARRRKPDVLGALGPRGDKLFSKVLVHRLSTQLAILPQSIHSLPRAW